MEWLSSEASTGGVGWAVGVEVLRVVKVRKKRRAMEEAEVAERRSDLSWTSRSAPLRRELP